MVVNDQTPSKCNVQCYSIYIYIYICIPDDVTLLAGLLEKHGCSRYRILLGKVGR